MTIRQLVTQTIGTRQLRLSALTVLLCSANLLHAQELIPVEVAASGDSTVVYPASFFDQYTPVSANDMITRIPGVSLNNNNGGGRGLGSGGDLLIDGKRIAGKDNSASSQLTRIAANQVERIEIIRGSSGTLDVRGASQVINVVLKQSSNRSSVSAEISTDLHRDGQFDPGGSLSYGGQSGDLNYLFNIEADPQYNHSKRNEYSYQPDLTLDETLTEDSIRDRTAYEASMNLGYDFERDRIQLNALFADESHPLSVRRNFLSVPSSTPSPRREFEGTDYEASNWEIGGNHEHSFANGTRFQFLFIVNEEVRDSVRERFALTDTSSTKNMYLESNRRTRERIGQGSYSWRLSDTQDMQVGLERAQTILDSSLYFGSGTTTGAPSPRYGNLVPVLGASNPGSTVEEMRYETFAVHNWMLNDKMTLESTLLYETSTIEQSGTANRSRDFDFVRPKLDYRYDMTSSMQLRATVERAVSQLSFESFTATANNSDIDKETDAGNPDLVQEKEIRYEVAVEYRLPNDGGVLSSRAFYRDIDDVIGKVNISSNPDKLNSATGNLGNGRRYGIYMDASTRLGFLGLPDAVLTTRLNLFDSAVFDPILGEDRRFNGRGNGSIGFRHDIPALGLNYGFNYNVDISGGEKNVDVNTIERYEPGPNLSFFISKVAFDNITFRLESMNTLNSEFCRERLRFAGLSGAGVLEEIEDSCNGSGQKLALKIRTTF
ncbi:MAG: TonB-dependent receptor [Gammaproteobacteria bacterium]|nr:TonB-dependent receptor [Gammaproteobacteria bacterium]MDP2139428.1 TonB-dependent receptor [Gammaproteobacteria bacterium]MDP2346264.1 TonB-dependent receptor [Gammaproteobacteria bacterium]